MQDETGEENKKEKRDSVCVSDCNLPSGKSGLGISRLSGLKRVPGTKEERVKSRGRVFERE